jgi:hypothetical protein
MEGLLAIKDVVHSAQLFCADNMSYAGLHGSVVTCLSQAKSLKAHPAIVEVLETFRVVINRAWNEMGTEQTPLSAQELKLWIQEEFLDENGRTYQRFIDHLR